MMIHFVLILGLVLLAMGITFLIRGATTPAGPSTETIEQISAYGFAGTLPVAEDAGPSARARFDDLLGNLGGWFGSRFSRLRGRDYRSRLIAAGMYTTTPERLLGIQVAGAVGGAFLWVVLAAAAGMSGLLVVLGLVAAIGLGWVLPTMIVDSRARKRREQIERGLPDLIDLLVVTLEAGLSFPQSLRLAAQKIKEPLASEVRLTLQEQNMGLTLVEALEHFLQRVNSPGVRMFARSIAQGETMGVSTGHIMRNLALEMRKRQRAYAEERAQKAPIKILFPILFLIMPSLFIVILLPVFIRIADAI
jgi:tight adherence protein C